MSPESVPEFAAGVPVALPPPPPRRLGSDSSEDGNEGGHDSGNDSGPGPHVLYPGCAPPDVAVSPPLPPLPPPPVQYSRLHNGDAPPLPVPSITSPLSTSSDTSHPQQAPPQDARAAGPVPPGMEWVVAMDNPDEKSSAAAGSPEAPCGKGAPDNHSVVSCSARSQGSESPHRSRPSFWEDIMNKESVCGPRGSPSSTYSKMHVFPWNAAVQPHLAPSAAVLRVSQLPHDCLLSVCRFLTMRETLVFSETCAIVWLVTSHDNLWSIYFGELFCAECPKHTVEAYVRAQKEAEQDATVSNALANAQAQGVQVVHVQAVHNPAGAVALPQQQNNGNSNNAGNAVNPASWDSDDDNAHVVTPQYTHFRRPVSLQVRSALPEEDFKLAFLDEKVALNTATSLLRDEQAKQEMEVRRLRDRRQRVHSILRHAMQFASLTWVIVVLLVLVCGTVSVFSLLLHVSPSYASRFDPDAPMRLTLKMFQIITAALFTLSLLLLMVLLHDSYDVHSGGPDANKPTRIYKHVFLDVLAWCTAFSLLTNKLSSETVVEHWSYIPFPVSVVNGLMLLDGMYVILRSLLLQSHYRVKEAVLSIFIATASAPLWLTLQLVAFSTDFPEKISCHGALIPTYVMLLVVGITAGIGTLHGLVRTLKNSSGRDCVAECVILMWYSLGTAVYVGIFVFFVIYSCTDAELALSFLSGFMLISTSLWWTLSAVMIK